MADALPLAAGNARPSRFGLLAPFRVRSFRFQYPADLSTSWGIEMENLVLSWYVLVASGSVVVLTAFWSLQYLGTLIAPVFGMAGDRVGHRRVLCAMRAVYTVLSLVMMALAFSGVLRPALVFAIAAISGLIRPSDQAMRNALVAETMPPDRLMATMGVARTTSDSARIFGPLAGAGLVAAFGMGPVYAVIAAVYGAGFGLTLGVGGRRGRRPAGSPALSLWRDLRDGLAFVRDAPDALAAMWLAFLVNLTAFPLTSGLLPYVARDVYRIDETGLGMLVASFSVGALIGSLSVSLAGRSIRPARMMLIFALAWYAFLLLFAQTRGPDSGRVTLALAGFAQSLSLVPMAVMLLRGAGERFRGRVMGVRMLAIYGVPIGLLGAGLLIDRIGFTATITAYSVVGAGLTLLIAWRWRIHLWPRDALSNAR